MQPIFVSIINLNTLTLITILPVKRSKMVSFKPLIFSLPLNLLIYLPNLFHLLNILIFLPSLVLSRLKGNVERWSSNLSCIETLSGKPISGKMQTSSFDTISASKLHWLASVLIFFVKAHLYLQKTCLFYFNFLLKTVSINHSLEWL